MINKESSFFKQNRPEDIPGPPPIASKSNIWKGGLICIAHVFSSFFDKFEIFNFLSLMELELTFTKKKNKKHEIWAVLLSIPFQMLDFDASSCYNSFTFSYLFSKTLYSILLFLCQRKKNEYYSSLMFNCEYYYYYWHSFLDHYCS